jgi:hypothetical protein
MMNDKNVSVRRRSLPAIAVGELRKRQEVPSAMSRLTSYSSWVPRESW